MSIEIKKKIETYLQAFLTDNLTQNALNLFNTLGYNTDRQASLDKPNFLAFKAAYAQGSTKFNEEKAVVKEWKYVDLLFQLSKDEVTQQNSLFDTKRVDNKDIQSYLFFAIELSGIAYSRTALAQITREVNKLFPMPAMVLFKTGNNLTLSIINRRLHKKEENKDVLEKVTLIKDISIGNPHRAHIEILFDLSFDELLTQYNFTNFVELHDAWQKTLDTKELNKRFYQELASWYFWAKDKVQFPADIEKDNDKRNSISLIRLITRIIFIWFIREKKLVPDDLFNSRKLSSILKDFNRSAKSSSFYSSILQNLFFGTLNQKMGERGFVKNGTIEENRNEYGIKNLYRYADQFLISEKEAIDLFKSIPFLNGGLFDCLDKPDDSGKIFYSDGFSRNPKKQAIVPDFLFFGPEQDCDLNEIFGTHNKRYKVKGLFELLSSYKFTITENTPIEEEIALDPELFGKVFENLLASYNPETQTTARKQTGSFNTPRENVNYMVDESLIAYLKSALLGKTQVYNEIGRRQTSMFGNEVKIGQLDIIDKLSGSSWQDKEDELEFNLRQLLSYNEEKHLFSNYDVEILINAIDACKIFDPACGSGAFPMGILLKLVMVLHKLDPQNEKWKRRQVQKAKQIDDPSIREKSIEDIEEAFKNNDLDYGRKLYLIENCIYGVDIQPIAVQITKLRFFISLIIDQKKRPDKENLGIRSLPNLETKFVAANTLIGIQQQAVMRNVEIDDLEAELKDIRHDYFSAKTRKEKLSCQKKDKDLRTKIASLLESSGWDHKTAVQVAQFDPYDQNHSAGFFDLEWMFGFAPNEGFDIVIGNPPYLRVQGIQQTQPEFMDYYKKHYKSAKGSFDLYALFIERGYQFLNNTGQFSYIVPHKFFQASFGEALRKLLTGKKALRQVVRFGSSQVFDEATTYTCLLFLSAQQNEKFDMLEVKTLERGEEVLNAARQRIDHPDYSFEKLPVPIFKNESNEWDFALGTDNNVLKRIQQHRLTLSDITRKIFVGLQTSFDKIYVLEFLDDLKENLKCFSKHLEEEIEIEKGLVKPFLMGKDVHRYEKVDARNVVIFPYIIDDGKAELMSQSFIKKNYPLGWKYLKKNEIDLANREHGKMKGNEFYAYIYPKNLAEFAFPKIMTPEIALGCQMTLDVDGEFYHTTKVYSFIFKLEVKSSPKYFLGVLNSKVLWFFLSSTGYVLRGGYYTFKTDYLKPFPIPESTIEQENIIETLVDYILYLKAQKESPDKNLSAELKVSIAYFEQLIDCIVYELYFPELFNDSVSNPTKQLLTAKLPALKSIKGNKSAALLELFKMVYSPSHSMRKMAFFIDSLDVVRTIEAKSKNL